MKYSNVTGPPSCRAFVPSNDSSQEAIIKMINQISKNKIPTKPRGVLSKRVNKNKIVIQRLGLPDSFFFIDFVAAEAWDLMNGSNSFSQIVALLKEKHPEATVNQVESKLMDLVNSLIKNKLVQMA